MPTALAAIEDAFGDALGPDLIAGLPAWSEARLIEARERYLESARQLVPPLLAPGHLRPYVPIAASLVATPIRGHGHEVPLSRTAGLFLAHAAMGFTESEHLSPALTQLLLYCHSVALEDFVAAAMDPDPAVLGKGAWTARVAVALARLCELRSLVEKEIVVILPSPGARGESVKWPEVSVEAQTEILHELLEVPEGQQYPIFVGPGTEDLLRKVPAERPPGGFQPYLVSRYEGLRDMYPNIEGISENADVWCWVLYAALVDSLTGWTWSASRSAEAQAVQVGLHPGGLDYYAPTYATRRALEMLAVADRPVASERMRQLLSLSVPGVEVVSTEDLVAIRADSPALETWRTDLSTLLEEMRRFNEPDQARRDALARDWMQESQLAMEAELVRPTMIQPLRANAATLAVGTVATAPFGGLAAAGPSQTVAFAIRSLLARRGVIRLRRQEAAVLSHYVSFSSPREPAVRLPIVPGLQPVDPPA